MAIIQASRKFSSLEAPIKRSYLWMDSNSSGSTSAWVWARWLLFIVVVVVCVLYIFLTNMRRRRQGRNPIVGTSWLAPPPAYGMSQRQYNQPVNENPVPEYTEAVNENDAGFFDNEGKFHPTQNVTNVSAPDPVATAPTAATGYTTQAPPSSGQTHVPMASRNVEPFSTSSSPSLSSSSPSSPSSPSSRSNRYVRPNVPPPKAAHISRPE